MNLKRFVSGRLLLLPTLAAAGSLALVACGGDDDDGGGGGSGSDEDYVASLCGAYADFEEQFDELLADFNPSNTDDLDDFMSDAAEIVGSVVDGLEDANPPGDVEDAHENLLTAFRSFRDTLEEGDFGAVESADEPDFELPQDVEDRLSAAAENVDECRELDLFTE